MRRGLYLRSGMQESLICQPDEAYRQVFIASSLERVMSAYRQKEHGTHLPIAGRVPVVLGVDPGSVGGGRDRRQLSEGGLRSNNGGGCAYRVLRLWMPIQPESGRETAKQGTQGRTRRPVRHGLPACRCNETSDQGDDVQSTPAARRAWACLAGCFNFSKGPLAGTLQVPAV